MDRRIEKETQWESASGKYHGMIVEKPDKNGKRTKTLLLTQESQVQLARENNRRLSC